MKMWLIHHYQHAAYTDGKPDGRVCTVALAKTLERGDLRPGHLKNIELS